MSNKFDEPWSTREKVELLVNIIQGQQPDIVAYLSSHIRAAGIVPQWQHIALPQGRSLDACQGAFDSLLREQRVQQNYPFGAPPSAASYQPQQQHMRVFTEPIPPHNIPRAIQPRPSPSTGSPAPISSNGGDTLTIVRTAGGPEFGGGAEKRKKRGRPTKEEAEERDRLLAAEGKVYAPKKRPSKKFRSSTGTSIPAEEVTIEGDTAAALREHSTPDRKQQITPGRTIEAPRGGEDLSSSGKKRKLRSQQESHRHSAPTTSLQTGSPRASVSKFDAAAEKPAESPSDRFMARFSDRGGGHSVVGGGETSSSSFRFMQPGSSSMSKAP